MSIKMRKAHGYLWGLLLVLAGFLFFFLKTRFALLVFSGFALLFLVQVLYQFFTLFFKKDQAKSKGGFSLFLNSLLALFLFNNALLPARMLALFASLEFFAIGLILLLDYAFKLKNRTGASLGLLLDGLVHFVFGILAMVRLDSSLDFIYSLFGLSLLIRGLSSLWDTWQLDRMTIASPHRRNRLALPIFLSALIPVSTLRSFNQLLSPDKSQPLRLDTPQKENQQPDMEIWIHTARQGFEMMGHVDISYQGKTYAFGQYDVDSSKLFGTLGDGVLFRLSSHDYLDSLAQEDWRAVVAYGLILTDQQKQLIEERLQQIMDQTQPFVLQSQEQMKSYLGQLNQRYRVENFKFTNSQFKTYFVMTTNCVLLADTILEVIGTDNVANHGILTPGVYQDYFEREYQRPHSNVVSKFVLGRQV